MRHLCWLLLPATVLAVPIDLAADGRAQQPVIVAASASDRTQAAATTLADYLSRITGATFAVERGDGSHGIVVGLGSDYPTLVDPPFSSQPHRREEYLLRSAPNRLLALGATDLAVEDAVWDLLGRIGYRQYFPGATWEIVPSLPRLTIDVDDREAPDYLARRIWYGFGPWDYNAEPYRQWCARNRCVLGIDLQTGHSYDGIVKALKPEFDAHPEYWPLLDGERKQINKPCLGNPAVRKLIVEYALRRFEQKPEMDSISMDPSDGGGWCQCELCAQLGSVSDRAVTLANEVAVAVNARYPGKLVGMLAYSYHSPPPTIAVDPHVIVSAANGFIRGGLTFDEMLTGWSARGAVLGIYDYYSVNIWDRDMPGSARGGNIEYLSRTIPEFHGKGARFVSAESSDNWGPNGLGYWLAARMFWDIDEAQRVESLIDDFLIRAFGPAAEPMRAFYEELDGGRPHLVIDDQLGRMFRALDEARRLADSPAIRERIDALTLYAQYASLYHTYESAAGPERQAAFETMVRHTYRMRRTMMVHAKALYLDLVTRDKTVSIPAEAGWQVPEADNPWKSSTPFSAAELGEFIDTGIGSHPLVKLDFQPVTYSTELVPAAKALGLTTDLTTGTFGPGRKEQTFYTYAEQAPSTLTLQITGGLIAHYRDRGNVRVEVHQLGGASRTGEKETLVATDQSVPPDGVERTITLDLPEQGLYRVTIRDGDDKTEVKWPANQPMTVISSEATPMTGSYLQWTAYFYVPRGTKVVGLFGGGHGEVRDSQDRPLFWLNGREPNFYSVTVPPGEDGRLWQVRYGRGAVRLMTVPPCFSDTPAGLLLPREVIERDVP